MSDKTNPQNAIFPNGGDLEIDLDMPETGLPDLSFDSEVSVSDIAEMNYKPAEGNLDRDTVEKRVKDRTLDNTLLSAESIEMPFYSFSIENSTVLAGEIQGNLKNVYDSFVAARDFDDQQTHVGTGSENSVFAGDLERIKEFNGSLDLEYGTALRESKDSTWIGDLKISNIFRRSHGNLVFGNIGTPQAKATSMFEDSSNNMVISDEVHAERIGSSDVNIIATDFVSPDASVSENTVVLEGDDFQGSKENLATFFSSVPNRVLEPLRAFDLEDEYENWKELDEDLGYMNSVWPEIADNYFRFDAVEDLIDTEPLEGEKEEIYRRLKGVRSNIDDISRLRTDQEVVGFSEVLDGDRKVYLADNSHRSQKVFSFNYDCEPEEIEKLMSELDDEIADELSYFSFNGGSSPEDLLEEIEEVKQKSERIDEEYEDILSVFENLETERFDSKGNLEQRLEGFDDEIKQAAKEKWNLSDDAANGIRDHDRNSVLLDEVPKVTLSDDGRDSYLQVVTGNTDSSEEITFDLDNVSDVQPQITEVFESSIKPGYQAQVLQKIIDDVPREDDSKRSKISGFFESLEELPDKSREELIKRLKTDEDRKVVENNFDRQEYSSGESKFGKTLVEIGSARKFNFFIDDESERIQRLLEEEGDLPEVNEFFDPDSPYREIVEDLTTEERLVDSSDEYGQMSDRELLEGFKTARGLAEELGIEYDASDAFNTVSKKERLRKRDSDFDPEEDGLEDLRRRTRLELEKDVKNKLRSYTKDSLKKLGFDTAAEAYEEATGETPEEITDNELAALKIRDRFGQRSKRESAEKLLKHQNNSYKLEENQRWLEKHGFNEEDIFDPDLSDQTDETYSRPEDPDYRSELRTEVDESTVMLDVEAEKEQYWEELQELASQIGIGKELESEQDIEKAEEVLKQVDISGSNEFYKEAKDVVNNYKSVDNRSGGIPDELSLRVADPMDTVRMGEGFGSCMNVEGGINAWGAPAQAIDANKLVFYAEDEKNRERARVKAFITEDEELVYHNTSQYKDIDIDTTPYFEDYMQKISDELDLELKHSSEADPLVTSVESLEADEWYASA